MRDKGTYIKIIIVLFLFAIALFLFFGVDSFRESSREATFIVGENTVWSYQNKKWIHLTSAASLQKLDWKKYQVYVNNQKLGQYSLWHDDQWYAFDDQKNAIPLEGELLAYRANYPITISSFEEQEILDDSPINQVLENHNLSLSSNFTSKFRVLFDFDGDGIEEDFYVISNVFALDFHPDTIFSIVFMVKDNQIYPIYDDVSSNQAFNGCKPYFQTFFDVNEDKQYEFVLSCGYYADSKRADMLYQFQDGAFKIIISNQ